MRRLAAVFALVWSGLAAAEGQPEFPVGREVYQTCSACHLANGEGVPGAFPPINDHRIAHIAASAAGRDYLLHTVLNGINGPMKVGGVQYQGYMQGYSATLSDQQISQVLNYVALRLGTGAGAGGGEGFTLFTQAEVAKARLKFAAGSPSSIEQRAKLGLE